jgi:AraC-like DNA-binding protein
MAIKNEFIQVVESLRPFVKSIMVFECDDPNSKTILPFYADGFPGLIYHETANGLSVQPHKKLMPKLFLYGQTLEPITVEIFGKGQMIVFQLYPFTLKSLFSLDPKSLNDWCHDLDFELHEAQNNLFQELTKKSTVEAKIEELSVYIINLIELRRNKFDHSIHSAINKIVAAKGNCSLLQTASEVNLTKRTFERRFFSETGLLPKQFARIIQFQNSLAQLTTHDYSSLSDIVHQNGFSDQSHFIRVFKSFTDQTPKNFIRKKET